MKTLLLNGCSYTACWDPSTEFLQNLDCQRVVNIAKVATSFQRTCRSTIEWIAQNEDPNFIILPITYCHRLELALNKEEDSIDGSWIPLQNSNFLKQDIQLQDTCFNDLKNFVDDYYKIIPNVKTYWDKLFSEIIMLAGWLDSRNIDYLMFDICNEFDVKHIAGYKGFSKLNIIKGNKKIIDLFTFCGNRHMWNTLDDTNKKDKDPNMHHGPMQYLELERYLLNYLKTSS